MACSSGWKNSCPLALNSVLLHLHHQFQARLFLACSLMTGHSRGKLHKADCTTYSRGPYEGRCSQPKRPCARTDKAPKLWEVAEAPTVCPGNARVEVLVFPASRLIVAQLVLGGQRHTRRQVRDQEEDSGCQPGDPYHLHWHESCIVTLSSRELPEAQC